MRGLSMKINQHMYFCPNDQEPGILIPRKHACTPRNIEPNAPKSDGSTNSNSEVAPELCFFFFYQPLGNQLWRLRILYRCGTRLPPDIWHFGLPPGDRVEVSLYSRKHSELTWDDMG